ncbi:hypothetical protein FQY79_11440 [Luteimonas wenzhouensis]|uniref:Lhr-like DEAD/H associated domain-containing protein n=1 Tax=Luteimonas wenzhouensis TaxID=2599615 RepID=A0A5C5TWD5_9GAMM|nr:hypothetical protein FQY79_11440 [Luteimonas wenzhouensis]
MWRHRPGWTVCGPFPSPQAGSPQSQSVRRRRIDHEQPAPGCSAAHPPGSRAGRALAPLLELQARISALPAADGLLAEFAKTREGWHLFVYPFAGRGVHEGLAALLALRWSRLAPNTFGFAVNDYGLALTAHARTQMDADTLRALLDPAQLFDDLRDGANLGELARRQFREIARVAGLLPPSLPGRALRSLRQLQASGRQLLRLP